MSNDTSSIMPSSSASSSSSSGATKIGDLLKQMNETPIHSCVIGISELAFHSLNRDIAHTALFLTNKKRSDLLDPKSKSSEGIVLEYGAYPPDEKKAKEKEESNIKNGFVIYRYGEKDGLRYYTNTFEYFQDKFCDIGYITLKVNSENQETFFRLIDILAPLSENKWTKENYNAVGMVNHKQNCQDFVCHVINIIKPPYEILFITKGKNSSKIKDEDKEKFVPRPILETLKNDKE